MKKLIFACLLTAFAGLNAAKFDLAKDQQIIDSLSDENFSVSMIQYKYRKALYSIGMIQNPQKETLWGGGLTNPISPSFILKGNLPMGLKSHLEKVIRGSEFFRDDAWIDLQDESDLSLEGFETIHPISVAKRIDDPKMDSEIKEVFHSTTFVNKVFYYCLDGNTYQVRILYNPENRTLLKEKKHEIEGQLTNYTVSWNNKYGIMVDKEAPQELINHLSDLANPSWKDWIFNFSIENGTMCQHCEQEYGFNTQTTITHEFDTWFDYAKGFK